MKVWASATAIGFSMAYLACSSSPTDGNTYVGGGAGGASTAGSAPTAGATTGTAGTRPTGGGADMGGAATTGGAPPAGGAGGGAPPAGGAGGGAPPAGGAAGAGGGTPGTETEVPCPANVAGHCSSGVTYPTYPGYTLNLVEDFPAALNLDTDPIITWSDGSPADGQTGFRKDNLTFANGKLIITAESTCPAKTTNSSCYPPRTAFGEALSPNKSASIGAMGVWSGELRTKYNNYRYGRYEVKYSAPIANPGMEGTDGMSGNYLSTMFVFRTPKNVQWNEIDIELEPWHHDQVAGNVVNATGQSAYPAGNADAWMKAPGGAYAITQEHVYAFTWTPTAVDWYMDGVSVQHFAGSASDPIPTLSAKIMMNLWIFSGNTFGDGVNNKFPFHATYDYFHFYKLDTETKYPCSPVPTCLDPADFTKSSQNNPTETGYPN